MKLQYLDVCSPAGPQGSAPEAAAPAENDIPTTVNPHTATFMYFSCTFHEYSWILACYTTIEVQFSRKTNHSVSI